MASDGARESMTCDGVYFAWAQNASLYLGLTPKECLIKLETFASGTIETLETHVLGQVCLSANRVAGELRVTLHGSSQPPPKPGFD